MDCRLVTHICFLIFNVTVCQARICPNVRSEMDDQKMLTSNDVRTEYVRAGHYLALECCSLSYDIITWYRWNLSADTWMDYLPCDEDTKCTQYKPDIIEGRQVLEIKDVDVSDQTSYKCIIKSSNGSMQRTFQVNVVACDELARGPFAIYPNPEDLYVKSFGEDVSFPCIGYFGCNDADFSIAEWLILDENTENWIDASSIGDDRYNVTFFTRSGSSISGANLTISSVKEIDLRRKFRCVLANAQVVEGQTHIDVRIQMINSADPDKREQLLVAVYALSIMLVFTLLLFIATFLFIIYHKRKEKAKKASFLYSSSLANDPTIAPMVLHGIQKKWEEHLV